MRYKFELHSVSDDALLRRVPELLKNTRHVEAELIAHLAEVDLRRLYARTSSSLYSYSTHVLHMSEYEALLRMRVARASRKHPVLLEMLADGRLHLSGIDKLAPVLTRDNCERLLARAVHRSKRDIEELVAEVAPKPDVPPSIRKMPERRATTKLEQELLGPDQVLLAAPDPQREKPEVNPSVVDKGRCVFKDATGRPCAETERLEFHHVKPFGRKGNHHPSNIELRCRAHNLYEAERDYGKFMNKYRNRSDRVSESAAFYTFSNRTTSAHRSQ